jgi:hypothetical protein
MIMKKQTLWLLFLGTFSMAFSLFVSPLVQVPTSVNDFLKGLGIAFIFSALLVERKLKRAD